MTNVEKPFFHELANLTPGNQLYDDWLSYILSYTKKDVQEIINHGLKYQAEALRSMARELIANQAVPKNLLQKLDLIVSSTIKQAQKKR